MLKQQLRKSKIRLRVESLTSDGDLVALALHGKFAKSARLAVRKQREMGIPLTYKKGNQIVKKFPDGHTEVLGTIQSGPFRVPKGIRVIGK